MLNIRGKLIMTDSPLVMGIINITSDSFFAGSRISEENLVAAVRRMLADGADIIDLGACSTRPGSCPVGEKEELEILTRAVKTIRHEFPEAVLSVDTFRSSVASASVLAGADIINDVSGGSMDGEMFSTVASLKVPYVLTHMRGTPETMQSKCDYEDVTAEVLRDLAFKADRLRQLGMCDVIIDPGFGFAKTPDQNWKLLSSLGYFKAIGAPLLVGLSRKSMLCRELGISPDLALNATTAANMLALVNGADILRVHDVKDAKETVNLFLAYRRNMEPQNTITVKDFNND